MFEKFKKGLDNILKNIRYKEFTEKDFIKIKENLIFFLIENDVAYEVAEDIVVSLSKLVINKKYDRSIDSEAFLRRIFKEFIRSLLSDVSKVDFDNIINYKDKKVKPILFIGINGVGKTTTIAKIGFRYKNMGYRILFACSDTFRAGAIEQLEIHAKNLGIPMFKHQYGADPAAVAYDAISYAKSHRYDLVLIDTAGRQHSNINLMEELKKIRRVSEPYKTILILDALTGNDAYYQAMEFNDKIGFDGVIFTKVDADVKGGSIITVSYLFKKPIYFLGTGQRYEDLIKFDVESFLKHLFGE